MDWAAVGSLGAVAAALVAYLQYKHLRSSNAKSAGSVLPQTPPELIYHVMAGVGRRDLPDKIKLDPLNEGWAALEELRHDLRRIGFAFLTLHNKNSYAVHRIALELAVANLWSVQLTDTKLLSKSAVKLEPTAEGLHILIDEMPAEEKIVVAILFSGFCGSLVRSSNAAVKLKGKWD
jgi:hypothetical protein